MRRKAKPDVLPRVDWRTVALTNPGLPVAGALVVGAGIAIAASRTAQDSLKGAYERTRDTISLGAKESAAKYAKLKAATEAEVQARREAEDARRAEREALEQERRLAVAREGRDVFGGPVYEAPTFQAPTFQAPTYGAPPGGPSSAAAEEPEAKPNPLASKSDREIAQGLIDHYNGIVNLHTQRGGYGYLPWEEEFKRRGLDDPYKVAAALEAQPPPPPTPEAKTWWGDFTSWVKRAKLKKVPGTNVYIPTDEQTAIEFGRFLAKGLEQVPSILGEVTGGAVGITAGFVERLLGKEGELVKPEELDRVSQAVEAGLTPSTRNLGRWGMWAAEVAARVSSSMRWRWSLWR